MLSVYLCCRDLQHKVNILLSENSKVCNSMGKKECENCCVLKRGRNKNIYICVKVSQEAK